MPNYKRLFLEGYNYFLTVITYQRNPILIDNIDLLRKSFQESKKRYHYNIDAIVILPDHFHTILTPKNPTDYPLIIRAIKQYFSKHCNPKYYQHLVQSHSRETKDYKPIWQKRFFEHTIRNERDYQLRLDYIHYNPVKHNHVLKTSDWEHSSFSRFVKEGVYDKDWGDFDATIDFE